MLDECTFCGGSLHPKMFDYYDQIWGGKTYRFENVSALVCAACGEVYFEARVSQAMDTALTGNKHPKRFDRVPVLELP